MDEMTAHLKSLQDATGVKLLWATQNLFSHPRYMNGAFTNPDAHVFAYGAAQVKKLMDVNHALGGENLGWCSFVHIVEAYWLNTRTTL